MANTIQIFEYEKLTIHPDQFNRSITPAQFEKLCQFNDNNKNKYFTVIRNGVKFSNYVGVIQIGSLVIEILPKADKASLTLENKDKSFATWRNVLLKMLAVSGEIKLESVSESMLKKRYNSLLELYYDMYLKEVSKILRKGLIKKYRYQTANVNALKGRIQFSKNIQQNLIHQERFHTTHQTYDFEHLINQILVKGLRVLKGLTSNESIHGKLNKLLFAFPEIKEVNIDSSSFDKIHLNRKTESYAEALKIAKMIILNYSPDISKGQNDMLALLFDMNKLWEKYIYRRLKQNEKGNYKVQFQNSQKFWNNKVVKPDIVLKKLINEKEVTFVIDTKWKIVDPNKPSDDDLKQMFVYNLYWGASKSLLLYPKTNNQISGDFGKYHKGNIGKYHNGDDKRHFCKVGFVDVLDGGELSIKVADEVLSLVFEEKKVFDGTRLGFSNSLGV